MFGGFVQYASKFYFGREADNRFVSELVIQWKMKYNQLEHV